MKPMSYGDKTLTDFLPPCNYVEIKSPVEEPIDNLEAELYQKLENPIGFDKYFLKDTIKSNPGGKIIILVDDHTRPNKHTRKVLPHLLKKLSEYGAKDINIKFATGSHRDPTEEEQRRILGDEVYDSYKDKLSIHDYRSEDCVYIGDTSTGVPIRLNKDVVEADLVIALTDTAMHYFAGFDGTRKEFCPGVAHEETIKKTHAKMFDPEHGLKPECRLGNVENNPVSDEFIDIVKKLSKKKLDEGGYIFGIDVIMCGDEPVHIAAGDILDLHKQAIPIARKMRTVEVESKADVTIVDPGLLGQNLYQAGKAFNCGSYSVKKGGKLIVLAPCDDGVGNDAYEKKMDEINKKRLGTKDALTYVLEKYCTDETFKIGIQKIIDILRIKGLIGENNLYLFTDRDAEFVERMRLQPIPRETDDPEADLKKYLEGVIEEDMTVHLIHDPSLLVTVKK